MSKPNILYIVLDQWRGDCLGLADSAHPVMTPHIDQVAYEGAWFRRAYADCPLCMPQRATMLIGQTASQHGMPYNFLAGPRSPIPLDLSLPYRLTREAGYQSKAVGKMHFYPERARFGFEHITLHPDDYVNWLEEQGYGGLYRGHGVGGNEVYPVVSPLPERYSHTNWKVAEAIRFLGRRDPEAPFFLWLVFEAPHSPFDPPAPYDRLYDDFAIPEAVVGDWVGTDQEPLSLLNLPAERIIFGETRTSVFATDGRFKYIYYLDGGVEHLFDVMNDPDDRHNLAAETAVAGEKKRLKHALQAYLAQHARPVLDENGEFVVVTRQLDETALRAENMAAWRGPLRYGQGYG